MMTSLKVLVTNASSRTTHTFLPMLCSGSVFGSQQRIELVLFDFKPLAEKVVELKEELNECCYPNITSITATINMSEAFKNVDIAILSELESDVIGFRSNAVLFRSYGIIINRHACKDVKVLVCGDTANTSAFICSSFSPSIPPNNYTCLVQHLQQHIIFNLLQQQKLDVCPRNNNNNSSVVVDNSLLVDGGSHNNSQQHTTLKQQNTNAQQQHTNIQQQNKNLQKQQQLQPPKVYCKILNDFMKNNDSLFNNHKNEKNNNANNNNANNNNANNNDVNNTDILVWGNSSEPIITPYNMQHSYKSKRKALPGAMLTAKCMAEHLSFWLSNTSHQEYLNMGIMSTNAPYNIDNNIYFNMPVTKKECNSNNNNYKRHKRNTKSSGESIKDEVFENEQVYNRPEYKTTAGDNSYEVYNSCDDQSYILSASASIASNDVTAAPLKINNATAAMLASTNTSDNVLVTSSMHQTNNGSTLTPLKMEVGPQLQQLLTQASKQLCQQRDNAIIDCWRIVLPHSHL